MAENFEITDAGLLREAEEVATNVRALRRLLRRSFERDIARSGLTLPQINALEELTKEDGLSLKELSGRMELSHSTVSGIVDRLERRGFVRRRQDSKDRRYSRIFLSEEVKNYAKDEVPFRRVDPILKALTLASAEERSRILGGIRTLKSLLEEAVSGEGANQKPEAAVLGQNRQEAGQRTRGETSRPVPDTEE